MDDNTKVLINELMEESNGLMEEAVKNVIDSERLNTIVFMLLEGAHLDYDGKALRVDNDEVIMSYLHAIRPIEYRKKLEALQKEKENKNGK